MSIKIQRSIDQSRSITIKTLTSTLLERLRALELDVELFFDPETTISTNSCIQLIDRTSKRRGTRYITLSVYPGRSCNLKVETAFNNDYFSYTLWSDLVSSETAPILFIDRCTTAIEKIYRDPRFLLSPAPEKSEAVEKGSTDSQTSLTTNVSRKRPRQDSHLQELRRVHLSRIAELEPLLLEVERRCRFQESLLSIGFDSDPSYSEEEGSCR